MSFRDVINQDSAVKILKEELDSERINHAYLFTGKEGVGKKTLAFEFIKALLCKNKKNDACNKCINCKKINHSNHPDVKFIKREEDSNQIKIDQIRALQKEISYRPYETDWKIYLIEEADNMSLPAANSLLKILEEPPDYGIIILLAEKIDQLLPTVISRCQRVKLNNISHKMIKKYLKQKNIEKDKLELCSSLADGSLGRALELIDNEEFFNKREKILNILSELPDLETVDIFEKSSKLLEFITDEFPFFNLISSWYRDIMLYMADNNAEILNFDYLESIKKQAQEYDIQEIMCIVRLINKYENYIERNVRKKLTIQVLLLKIRSKRV